MRETRTLPRMDTILDTALGIPNVFQRFIRKFYVSYNPTQARKYFQSLSFQRPFLIARYDFDVSDEDDDEDYDYYDDMYEKDLQQRVKGKRRRKRLKRQRKRPVKLRRVKSRVPEREWVLIDKHFNHPNRGYRVLRRVKHRPSIFPINPLDLIPRPRFRSRVYQYQSQNQHVPLSLLGKLQKAFSEIF